MFLSCWPSFSYSYGSRLRDRNTGSLWRKCEDRNGVLSAQNIIYAYQEELWATNWAEIEGDEEGKEADEPDAIQLMQTPKMTELRQELARMNYHFAVSIDGETVYSNLTESEIQEIRQIGGDVLSEADSVTLNDGKNSVIKKQLPGR